MKDSEEQVLSLARELKAQKVIEKELLGKLSAAQLALEGARVQLAALTSTLSTNGTPVCVAIPGFLKFKSLTG